MWSGTPLVCVRGDILMGEERGMGDGRNMRRGRDMEGAETGGVNKHEGGRVEGNGGGSL